MSPAATVDAVACDEVDRCEVCGQLPALATVRHGHAVKTLCRRCVADSLRDDLPTCLDLGVTYSVETIPHAR